MSENCKENSVDTAEEMTYLERVEAAAMSRLCSTVGYGDIQGAKAIVELLKDLSIV